MSFVMCENDCVYCVFVCVCVCVCVNLVVFTISLLSFSKKLGNVDADVMKSLIKTYFMTVKFSS